MAEERREEKMKGKQSSGEMTVSEAGRMGGERVRELIEEGKESEREQRRQSSTGQSSTGQSSKSSSRSGEQSR